MKGTSFVSSELKLRSPHKRQEERSDARPEPSRPPEDPEDPEDIDIFVGV